MAICALAFAACSGMLGAATEAGDWQWKDVERVVVVPDVHGAYSAFVRLLQAADVIDGELRWTGGATHLVSLGDLLDRGPESRATMDLLMRLQGEAPGAGGRVHVVAGNHELMNLIGDLRYVSEQEYAAFIDDESAEEREAAWLIFRHAEDNLDTGEDLLRKRFEERYPPGFFGHREAFSADGVYGQWLTSLPVVVAINDTVYVHGGLPPSIVGRSLAEINQHYSAATTRYLRLWESLIENGVLPDDTGRDPAVVARSTLLNAEPSDCVEERRDECVRVEDAEVEGVWSAEPALLDALHEFVELSDDPMLGPDSPMWYRGAVYCRAVFERPNLDAALAGFGVERVVVGHTVTEDRRVHALHDDRLIMLDTGMLADYYRGRASALIISGAVAQVLHVDPVERIAPVRDDRPVAFGLTRAGLRDALATGNIDPAPLAGEAAIRRVTVTHGATEIPAVFIPGDRSSRLNSMLAADKLDRLLGFELVPATVARDVDGQDGLLQFRDTGWLSEAQRQERGIGIGGWCRLDRQYQLMYAWDLLIGNSGRGADQILYDRSLGRLSLTGHADAFPRSGRLPNGVRDGAIQVAPEVAQTLAALSQEQLESELGDYLNRREIRALLSRRDEILERFTGERAAVR
jgi:hypothetical protein